MKHSRSEYIDIAGMTIHVRRWGTPGMPRLVLLHGWLDSSATFQFLVDAMDEEWDIIAPDWRGCGRSGWQNSPYWILQYVADLDRLLDFYSEGEPAMLVGHSLGGNVAGIFAAARPHRVSRLIILDAYGTGDYEPEELHGRLDRWLRGQTPDKPAHQSYPDIPAFAQRLIRNNRRLTEEQALFLATEFSIHTVDGTVVPALDPYQRLRPPPILSADDYKRLWRLITAPVLLVIANESFLLNQFQRVPGELEQRIRCFQNIRVIRVDDAAHNLHHDQPQVIAQQAHFFLKLEAESVGINTGRQRGCGHSA